MKLRGCTQRFTLLLICLAMGAPGLTGCDLIQTANTFEGDAELYAIVDGSPAFIAVHDVVKTYCAQCHAAFAGYSEQDFIDNGYVVAGDPGNSKIYTKLRGSNTGGDENMPPSSTLATGDLQKFYDWIEGI